MVQKAVHATLSVCLLSTENVSSFLSLSSEVPAISVEFPRISMVTMLHHPDFHMGKKE